MTGAVSLTAHKGQRDEAMARVQQQVVETAVAQVKAHMTTDQVQDALIERAVRKATDAVIAEERRIGRAHGWRGALFGAFGGAGIALFVIWIMLGGLTQSAAFMVKMGVYERQQDQLNQELSEKVHGQ